MTFRSAARLIRPLQRHTQPSAVTDTHNGMDFQHDWVTRVLRVPVEPARVDLVLDPFGRSCLYERDHNEGIISNAIHALRHDRVP